jgi:pyruvate dehydrogenase E2 component (dihydrolipoamide acetyltransferase)
VILRKLVREGTDVQVGEPIALIGSLSESTDDLDAILRTLGVSDLAAVPAAPALIPAAVPKVEAPTPAAPGQRLFASPLARRLARDAQLPIDELVGTGPNGRIVRRDIERAVADTANRADTAASVATLTERAEGVGNAAYVDLPLTRIRRLVSERLTESKRSVPHFYLRATAQVDRLLALRAELNDGDAPVRFSVNDLVVKAVARAHVLVPALNVIWTPDAIRQFNTVDVAVAVATPRGLYTPVVRSVERASLTSLATTIRDAASRAAAGQLQPHELEGGSVTVTNLGMFGVVDFAAIINPPHSSILAVGAVREEPVVSGGEVKVGSVMHLTLSVDHRPVDGAAAAEWMRVFVGLLERPVQIIAH